MSPDRPRNLFSRNEAAAQERKKQILELLSAWVAEKKQEDPSFNISHGNLTRDFIPLHQGEGNLFAEKATAGNAILKYFSNDINFLREKLGLPAAKER